MARVKLTSIFTEASGLMDEQVYYNRLGTQCSRAYVIPRNPDTELQRANRKTFAEAVKAWRELPSDEKKLWNKKAARNKGKTGYNLFMSSYMKHPSSGS